MIICNKDGIQFIRLADDLITNRPFQEKSGYKRMVHSLFALNFLKVEQGNLISLFNDENDNLIVNIEQE